MNPKISWCSGLAVTVLLVSVVLTACGYKTQDYSRAPTAVAFARYSATNGAPDTSLPGGSRLVTTEVSTSQDDIAFAVGAQPDRKIISVGSSSTKPATVLVIRDHAKGTVDFPVRSRRLTR